MLIWNFSVFYLPVTTQYAIHCIYNNLQQIRVNTENILLLQTLLCFYHQLPLLFCISCTHPSLVVSEKVTQTVANTSKWTCSLPYKPHFLQKPQNLRTTLQYKVCHSFFLSTVHSSFLSMRSMDQVQICTVKYSVWSCSPCGVFSLLLLISFQKHQDGWKRIHVSVGNWNCCRQLWQHWVLGLTHQTQPKSSGKPQKIKGLPSSPPKPFFVTQN